MSLTGKRIVVTGASGNLGSAVVRAALAAGATVAAIDHSDAPAPGVDLGGARHFGGVDVSDPDAARAAMDAAARALGGLDGLVNTAGTFRFTTLEQGGVEVFDLLYRVNVRTVAAASAAALPHLGEGGRIVNIGAASATRGGAGTGAYTASKSGVMRLTESLAAEVKDRGITVNAVLPSVIDTPANRRDMPKGHVERWVTPAQLADVIVFLLSDRASAVTGALIPVTGRV